MKRMIVLLGAAMLFAATTATAGVVNGVFVDGKTTPLPTAATDERVVPFHASYLINFDDVAGAACFFPFTDALRDQYADQGVRFRGAGNPNGGALLDECSGFGVTGHSPPNFLALSSAAGFPDGGAAAGPEFLLFDFPVDSVSFKAAYGSSGAVIATARDVTGTVVLDTTADPGNNSDLQTLTLQGPGIREVEIAFTGAALVIDDIIFERKVTISPHSGTFSSAQDFDLVLVVNPGGRQVVGSTISFNGKDVTSAVGRCVVPGSHPDGKTFRCPSVGALLPAGTGVFEVTLLFSDGSAGYDQVTWKVLGGSE